ERHAGFVGQAQLGLGWCTDDSCDSENSFDSELQTGLSLGAFLGYRFPWPHITAGGAFMYSFHPVDEEPRIFDDSRAYSWGMDFGVRAHPLVRGLVDPWAGLGFAYAFAGTSWENTLISDPDESTSLHGPGVAISLGVDFWVAENFAVGAAFKYVIVFWTELCVDTQDEETRWGGDTCADPEVWEEERDLGGIFFDFDENDLPDLGQLVVTGTFAP
ncbi:MAG: porin family protein, partial [Actinobacteria bacterium]|nr:porin family protein [Actinomycetota bacterium]